MVRDARRLDPPHEAIEAIEVPGVQPRSRAEREADAVQTHRPLLAGTVQHRERGAAVGEEILGMDLDEAEVGRRLEERRVVRMAQADAGRWMPQADSGRGGRFHHLFIAALASASLLPPICAQVPLAT